MLLVDIVQGWKSLFDLFVLAIVLSVMRWCRSEKRN